MLSDYEFWLKENCELLDSLKKNANNLYSNLEDFIRCLNFIDTLDEEEKDADLSFIFDEGYAYLFSRVNYIKHFLHDFLNDEMAKLSNYEMLVYYYIYTLDLHDALEREEVEVDQIDVHLNDIQNEIDDILSNNKGYSDDTIHKFNAIIEGCIPSNKELLTSPEIFSRILDELITYENKNGRKFKF